MSINICDEDVLSLNVADSGIMTKIDLLFEKNNNYKDCCINDFL